MLQRKIVHAITGAEAEESIRERIKQGRELFGGICLTGEEIVFSKGLKRVTMPLREIVWAYRRVEESHVSLGCCGGVIEEFKVMLRHESGKLAEIKSDREAIALAVMEYIEKHTGAAIGYTEENKRRFAL